METLIVLGKVLGASFFITKFAPIQWLLDLFYPSEKSNPLLVLIYNIVSLLTSCFSCCSFWVGTIFFGFWWGISAYVIAYLYNQVLAPFIEKIRLY
jgi:hypothetical protein